MYHEVDDYEIVSEHNADELKMKVKDFLAKGWKLYGDLQIVAPAKGDGIELLYTQVMIKANR